MKKIAFITLFLISTLKIFGQWTVVNSPNNSRTAQFYKLDLAQMRIILSKSKANGSGEVVIPTLNGKLQRFKVQPISSAAPELENTYGFASFKGQSVDNPYVIVRLSVSPYGFQSMLMNGNSLEFIDAEKDSDVYKVYPKSERYSKNKTGRFLCTTDESAASKFEISKLLRRNTLNTESARMSDRKFRTLRLAISTTAEYTKYFGGVPQALSAINATINRVNAIFERDFAVHLVLQNYPQLIFTDAATDPYSNYTDGVKGSWAKELQNTLTNTIGNASYDIGHLFGSEGGGGNAGIVGGVCKDDDASDSTDLNKGSAFTSPADGKPYGDTFDIDFVAHELGHQLGATHTFSYMLESYGTNVEPGSGSTIMGYAGITDADVQSNADDYFHTVSIAQVLDKLSAVGCDTEAPIANNPPAIAPLASYTIPKGTPFVLSASVQDAENDPLTYTWEQTDNATKEIKVVTGTETTGALFRSLPPNANAYRYFPKLERVLQGSLTNPSDWESVPLVSRNMNFTITARDNHPDKNQQQSNTMSQTIAVGNDGPFRILSSEAYNNVPTPIVWDVANTSSAPYNVSDVKLDYSTDQGQTWNVLLASTPNDGAENISFPNGVAGDVFLRISALNNVFYAVNKMNVSSAQNCGTTSPTNVKANYISTNTAQINWSMDIGAGYVVRYRPSGTINWVETSINQNYLTLNNLTEGTKYDVQVASVCSGSTGTFSPVISFATLSALKYCTSSSGSAADEFISNVTLANINNTSGASTYTYYSSQPDKLINLIQNSTYTLSTDISWKDQATDEAVAVWIDFNRDGTFDDSEMVMKPVLNMEKTHSATFRVPNGAVLDKVLRMRVTLRYNNPSIDPCSAFDYGEVEDYAVIISKKGSVVSSEGVKIYPISADKILHITNVLDGTAYKIYDMSGRIVRNGAFENQAINISSLVPAVYILSFDENGTQYNLKFIKN